ncbi:MAG: COX15/CtaA family protein [Acidobacteriota bacterium]|nr:COX15/CtaA family protein [Acidobacteriota bacterium]
MTFPRPRSPFVRLAIWTTALTYALILVGGLVRASGAGLGCPDWPKCFGSWIPPLSAAALPPQFEPSQFNATLMWTEYLNRLLGVTVGFFILATAVSAWRHHRRDLHILWPTVAALLLTGYEGWLGGRVVAHELAPWIVTAHLVVAILIVLLLLYATVYAIYRRSSPIGARAAAPPRGERADRSRTATFTTVVSVMIVITLAQVALGTQVRGSVDDALDAGVPRLEALATVGLVDSGHRTAALAVMSLALVSMLVLWSTHPRARVIAQWTYAVVALATAQVGIGAGLALVSLTPSMQVAHLTLASLLMGAQMVQLLVARWE